MIREKEDIRRGKIQREEHEKGIRSIEWESENRQ